jgi:glyoxylase I family protein
MRLNHVGICVRDIDKSLLFYRDALGLTLFQDELLTGPEVDASLMVQNGELRMVLLVDDAGTVIELFGWQYPAVAERPPEYRGFTTVGIVEVCLAVDDLEAVEKRLAEKGFAFRSPVWSFGQGSDVYGGAYAKIRYVEDPDGIQVELLQIVPADEASASSGN